MSIFDEIRWMQANPAFSERPATVRQFVYDPKYMNLGKRVRPGVMSFLENIFGNEVNSKRLSHYQRAMFTGAIGVGKTTFASIALPYMAHWVLCLNDPQDFYDLLPGSRIAFMQMSTSRDQARNVVFGDIKARIDGCRWFREKYPYDEKYTRSIRFQQKDIWILPGDSHETTFEGYNILGGILDEADSHVTTKDKDYADVGYNTIEGRIQSRYVDHSVAGEAGHKGLIIVVGQMKKQNGFAHEKYKEFLEDPNALVERMTIWESYGWDKYLKKDGTRDSFWYDSRRKEIIQDWFGSRLAEDGSANVIEIPNAYKFQFKTHPEKALKDLAGIPPTASDPFIGLTYKIEEAFERWEEKFPGLVPVDDNCVNPGLAEWVGTPGYTDSRRRIAHIDIAYSEDGDSAGIAVGYVDHLEESDDGEMKPFIVIECMLRFRAPPGGEVMISDLRRIIYELKLRGMRLDKVTMDGFQSTDTMQQFRKKKLRVDYASMDKTKLGYEDLREAIYENRIAFPPYMTHLAPGTDETVNILYQELIGLSDMGTKVDHPKNGSKDVADCVAAVTMALMGDRTFRKGVASSDRPGTQPKSASDAIKALMGDFDRTLSSQVGEVSSTGVPDSASLKALMVKPGILEVPDRLRPKG